jgi:hypothetical protein
MWGLSRERTLRVERLIIRLCVSFAYECWIFAGSISSASFTRA